MTEPMKLNLTGASIKCFGYDNQAIERVTTPVGAGCIHCEDPIGADDKGVIMRSDPSGGWPNLSDFGAPGWCAMHLNCMLANIGYPPR